jgi:hypothetical protein
MMKTTRFGRKIALPSTVQIKHQLLLFWLKDQTEKEAAEAAANAETPAIPHDAAVRLAPQ